MDKTIANAAVTATLDALYADLKTALAEVEIAREYMKAGERNATVGTLSIVEPAVKRSLDMLTAIMAIHQAAR